MCRQGAGNGVLNLQLYTIFHSDRGSQHASAELAAWAAAHDVRLSVGRTGSCHDNAVAESFFGTPRNGWYHHERPTDASTAKHRAIEFMESYYNRFRPHESIGDRVPAEVHAGALRPLRECPPGRSGSHAGRIEICDSAVHYIDRAHRMPSRAVRCRACARASALRGMH